MKRSAHCDESVKSDKDSKPIGALYSKSTERPQPLVDNTNTMTFEPATEFRYPSAQEIANQVHTVTDAQ